MAAHTEVSKAKWAETLNVLTLGYYTWLKVRSHRETRHKALEETVGRIFKKAGKGYYGAERVCGVIGIEGGKASFKKVKAIIDENN